jgi:hypothetical protein
MPQKMELSVAIPVKPAATASPQSLNPTHHSYCTSRKHAMRDINSFAQLCGGRVRRTARLDRFSPSVPISRQQTAE